MSKSLILAALFSLLSLTAGAQHRFDPEKFERNLEEFVIQQAGITPTEQIRFLPLFREKRQKEVAIMNQMRQERSGRPESEREIEKAIRKHDNAEIELKKVQQTYHNKLLYVLPASKLLAVIMAEEDYHRQQMAKMEEHRRQRQNRPDQPGGRDNQPPRQEQRPHAGRR